MPKNFDTNTQNRIPLCLQEKVGAEIANLSVIEMNLTLYNSENLKRNVYLSLWYWQRNVYVYGGKAPSESGFIVDAFCSHSLPEKSMCLLF